MGYAPKMSPRRAACIHLDGTHGAGSTDLLYINVGTKASCDFDAITIN